MLQPVSTVLKVKQTPFNIYMRILAHATTALASKTQLIDPPLTICKSKKYTATISWLIPQMTCPVQLQVEVTSVLYHAIPT